MRIRFVLRCVIGCLVAGMIAAPAAAQSDDPWESYNRAMYGFNQKLDKALVKPIARGYRAITPDFVNNRISDFFGNLNDVVTVFNQVLQFKLDPALMSTSRVVFNSTFGLLGLFDIATPLGMTKYNEDFGQTLGYWGIGNGNYFIMPLLGPTTTRDIFRYPVDYFAYPLTYTTNLPSQLIMRGADLIDLRADLLRAERAFGDAALDPYAFQREAYLQKRRSDVYDGNPPRPQFDFEDDELEDEPESASK